jgi:hypothetical protein
MQVYGLPVRIISWVESPSILVELIREHQRIFIAIYEGRPRIGIFGGIFINKPPISRNVGYLPGCIDATQVEAALSALQVPRRE